MSGLRIHHPTMTSCVLIVPHPGDSNTGRKPKDYPIHLDSEGNSIVSERVWQRLLEAEASGLSSHKFVVLNEVEDPPTIMMTNNDGKVDVVPSFRQEGDEVVFEAQRIAQQFAPQGIMPRIVKRKDK